MDREQYTVEEGTKLVGSFLERKVTEFVMEFAGARPAPAIAAVPATNQDREGIPQPPCWTITCSPQAASTLPPDVAELLRTGYAWRSRDRFEECKAELDALDTWLLTKAKKQVDFSKTKVMDLLAEDLADLTQYRIYEHTGYTGKIIVYEKQPVPTRFTHTIGRHRHWSCWSEEYLDFHTLEAYGKPVPRQAAKALKFTFSLPITPDQTWVADVKESRTPARSPVDVLFDAADAVLDTGGQVLGAGLALSTLLVDPILFVSFGRHLVPVAQWK